ncbi:hypothetical protein MMC13_004610 [Lambiella insularis]|nr:hypothetical protein [Lambiella insularis]
MHEPRVVPSSPALTNPDMILPYLPRSRSSTPTGRRPSGISQSRMAPANPYADPFDGVGKADRLGAEIVRPGKLSSESRGISRPHLPGVWQTEEDVHQAQEDWTNDEVNLATSPTIPRDAVYEEDHEFSDGISQTHMRASATIHNTERSMSPNTMKEGIDQEYGEHLNAGSVLQAPLNSASSRAMTEEDDGDTYLHAAEILANAKQRLTAMEGNLTRARSISVAASGGRTLNTRISHSPQDEITFHQGHQRSSSAMSPVRLDSEYEDRDGLSPLHSLTNAPSRAINRSISLGSRQQGLLEALREDDDATSFRSSNIEEQPSSLAISAPSSDRIDVSKQVRKARSRIELQDLQERIQALNGTASLMIRDIQQNKMQRRSLQTLKTPSPFTVSREWSNKVASPLQSSRSQVHHREDADLEIRRPTAKGFSPTLEPTTLDDNNDLQDDNKVNDRCTEEARNELFEPFSAPQHSDDESEIIPPSLNQRTEDSFTKPRSMSDELYHPMERPNDKPLSPPPKHEDRPDAFNYETFFIHSSTGTYSRIAPSLNTSISSDGTTRRYSQSSTSSADTTKAASPVPQSPTHTLAPTHLQPSLSTSGGHAPIRKAAGHSRQNSKDSISTENTFATAAESAGPGDISDDDFNLVLPRQKSLPYRPTNANVTRTQRLTGPVVATSHIPPSVHHQPPSDASFPTAPPRKHSSTSLATLLHSLNVPQLDAEDGVVVTDILSTLQLACRDLCGRREAGRAPTLPDTEWRLRLDEAVCALTKNLEVGVYRGVKA